MMAALAPRPMPNQRIIRGIQAMGGHGADEVKEGGDKHIHPAEPGHGHPQGDAHQGPQQVAGEGHLEAGGNVAEDGGAVGGGTGELSMKASTTWTGLGRM